MVLDWRKRRKQPEERSSSASCLGCLTVLPLWAPPHNGLCVQTTSQNNPFLPLVVMFLPGTLLNSWKSKGMCLGWHNIRIQLGTPPAHHSGSSLSLISHITRSPSFMSQYWHVVIISTVHLGFGRFCLMSFPRLGSSGHTCLLACLFRPLLALAIS